MAESEKLLERKIRDRVVQLGGWSIKLLSTHITGLPDRLCLLPKSRIVFIEVKTTKKKATKIQSAVHEKIRSLGFQVEVVDNSARMEQIFEILMNPF